MGLGHTSGLAAWRPAQAQFAGKCWPFPLADRVNESLPGLASRQRQPGRPTSLACISALTPGLRLGGFSLSACCCCRPADTTAPECGCVGCPSQDTMTATRACREDRAQAVLQDTPDSWYIEREQCEVPEPLVLGPTEAKLCWNSFSGRVSCVRSARPQTMTRDAGAACAMGNKRRHSCSIFNTSLASLYPPIPLVNLGDAHASGRSSLCHSQQRIRRAPPGV